MKEKSKKYSIVAFNRVSKEDRQIHQDNTDRNGKCFRRKDANGERITSRQSERY